MAKNCKAQTIYEGVSRENQKQRSWKWKPQIPTVTANSKHSVTLIQIDIYSHTKDQFHSVPVI